jgi:hypothetical protein
VSGALRLCTQLPVEAIARERPQRAVYHADPLVDAAALMDPNRAQRLHGPRGAQLAGFSCPARSHSRLCSRAHVGAPVDRIAIKLYIDHYREID